MMKPSLPAGTNLPGLLFLLPGICPTCYAPRALTRLWANWAFCVCANGHEFSAYVQHCN